MGEEGRDSQEDDRERERERETRGEEGILPAVEEEREEPETVGSCHHPELSSASEPQRLRASEPRLEKIKKNLSILNPQLTPQCVTTSIVTPLLDAGETR